MDRKNKSSLTRAVIIAVGALGIYLIISTLFPAFLGGAEQDNSATSTATITNFEECVQAGNPVMESYPRKCSADSETFTENIGNVLEKQDLIRIDNPRPNQTIESPLSITGEARGTWYFEADFSAKLVDESGQQIGSSIPVQAEGEWMTEEFVPYSGTLEFNTPSNATSGTLILEKANPSGLPENADELRVPVKF